MIRPIDDSQTRKVSKTFLVLLKQWTFNYKFDTEDILDSGGEKNDNFPLMSRRKTFAARLKSEKRV